MGYNPEESVPENLDIVLKDTDWFLFQLDKECSLPFIRAYVGVGSGGDESFSEGSFIILVVVSHDDHLDQKQLDAYRMASNFEELLQKRINAGVSASFMGDSEHFNEDEVKGDNFFYKRIFGKEKKDDVPAYVRHRRFSMILDPGGKNYCRECGGVCGNSKHGRS